MSLSSPLRPLPSVCRQCRQRLLRQPQQTCPFSSTVPVSGREFGRLPVKPLKLQNASGQHEDDNAASQPRWKRAPSAMAAPFRIRPKNDNDTFDCNEDPKKLDAFYVKMLGKDWDKALPEDVKWLAVTHKSFDHGRRGFNDRLAFLGRRIVELQTSLALIDAPRATSQAAVGPQIDQYGRVPFQHPSLENVESIAADIKERALSVERLAQLAQSYGIFDVMRWKPRQVKRLKSSGVDAVLSHTLYAIVGAIALQKGGDAANLMVKQKILGPLALGSA